MMPFGKYEGMDFTDIPIPYFRWLLDQDWLHDDLRSEIEDHLATRPAKKTRKPKEPAAPAWERYDKQNREAAEIILAEPERYAGMCLKWAQLWLRNHPTFSTRKTGDSLWRDWRDAGRKRA